MFRQKKQKDCQKTLKTTEEKNLHRRGRRSLLLAIYNLRAHMPSSLRTTLHPHFHFIVERMFNSAKVQVPTGAIGGVGVKVQLGLRECPWDLLAHLDSCQLPRSYGLTTSLPFPYPFFPIAKKKEKFQHI